MKRTENKRTAKMIKRCLIGAVMALTALPGFAADIVKGDNGLYGLMTNDRGQTKWIVKPKYVNIYRNTDDSYFVYGKNNKWGLITGSGEEVISCKYDKIAEVRQEYRHSYNPASADQYADFTLTRDYTPYIRDYVQDKINRWQQKNEFESTQEYYNRVSEKNRKIVIEQAVAEVCEECLNKVSDKSLPMTILDYDADNLSYKIQTPIGDMVVPVPRENAQIFKQNFPQMTTENTYDIVDGKVKIRSVVFSYNNKPMATYSSARNVMYAHAADNIQFEAVKITSVGTANNAFMPTEPIGRSDVDRNIPFTSDINDHTFALIFANENYQEESKVNYARNDGAAIYKYFTQTLGLPASNVKLSEDATLSRMTLDLEWLKELGQAYNGDIKVIVYYAGHGIPDENTREPYLIPADGAAYSKKTLFPLNDFYRELGEINSECTVLFLDACFTGSKRDDKMLGMARGVKLHHEKVSSLGSNMVVFSASQAGETAWGYDEQDHGLFTYFLLKKLKDSKGNVNLGDLAGYLSTQVNQYSVRENHKSQSPVVDVAPDMENEWQHIRLK